VVVVTPRRSSSNLVHCERRQTITGSSTGRRQDEAMVRAPSKSARSGHTVIATPKHPVSDAQTRAST
jgi:hypothetical protein